MEKDADTMDLPFTREDLFAKLHGAARMYWATRRELPLWDFSSIAATS